MVTATHLGHLGLVSRAKQAALAVAAASLAIPAHADAHVGPQTPVATNYVARITAFPRPALLDVRALNGDQKLWLRARPDVTVLVLGSFREPFVLFSPAGVSVNKASGTAYLNQARPQGRPPPLHGKPSWRHVSSAHTYAWHEHRLHRLRPLARGLTHAAVLGTWRIPLLVNGRRAAITGTLSYVPPPGSSIWLLGLGLAVACSLMLVRLAHGRIHRQVTVSLAIVGLVAAVLVFSGFHLLARPAVTSANIIFVGFVCLAAAVLTASLLLLSDDGRRALAILAGCIALAEGLSVLSVFTHGVILSAISSTTARVATVAAVAAGAGAVISAVFGDEGPALSDRTAA
jgi:hypothetical protein